LRTNLPLNALKGNATHECGKSKLKSVVTNDLTQHRSACAGWRMADGGWRMADGVDPAKGLFVRLPDQYSMFPLPSTS
ncbi:hypothetical protein, partial [Pseudomonas brassicacearum]|uniref:hypothetical protein n=1 Tax=Pseudomonas brassicacearum TaxID=930166 RepID=UPI001C83FC3A